ncbi:MAG: response regulator transcription factor [Burkholderiales bacterium]|nr:response regulator transcription factor [Burkholderiales bacterium]
MTLRVALVDDHRPFRERLRALLEENPTVKIVAEACSGQEILDIALTTEIDVACMDISMPGMNGIETTRRLLAIRPGVRVIGLSAYAGAHYVRQMLDAGAVGYFAKGDATDSLLYAMITATLERHFFGESIALPGLENAAAAPREDRAAIDARTVSLGVKEMEVLRLIAMGLASPQIAGALGMDDKLFEVYRRNIMRKLRLNDSAALVEYARRFDRGAG